MICRSCDSKNTRVTCTDHFPKLTKRYIRCLDCGCKFRTVEQYEKQKPGPPKGKPRPGNIARGSRHGASIFTEKDILGMRKMHRDGKTYKEISATFGIDSSYVSKIVNYKQWTHVP